MSHIESVNIKKQRKRLQNQKYYQKKRQKTEKHCAEQSLSENDVQYDQNVKHIPEIFNYNLRKQYVIRRKLYVNRFLQ